MPGAAHYAGVAARVRGARIDGGKRQLARIDRRRALDTADRDSLGVRRAIRAVKRHPLSQERAVWMMNPLSHGRGSVRCGANHAGRLGPPRRRALIREVDGVLQAPAHDGAAARRAG